MTYYQKRKAHPWQRPDHSVNGGWRNRRCRTAEDDGDILMAIEKGITELAKMLAGLCDKASSAIESLDRLMDEMDNVKYEEKARRDENAEL